MKPINQLEQQQGIVSQILPPGKQHKYLPSTLEREPFISGKYLIIIEKEDYPKKGVFKRARYRLKNGRYYWAFFSETPSFKVGDVIKIQSDGEVFYDETNTWIGLKTIVLTK